MPAPTALPAPDWAAVITAELDATAAYRRWQLSETRRDERAAEAASRAHVRIARPVYAAALAQCGTTTERDQAQRVMLQTGLKQIEAEHEWIWGDMPMAQWLAIQSAASHARGRYNALCKGVAA